jgi:hypothetical protein
MSGKKILAIGFVVVLLVAIPLTVFLIQQQQKTKTAAVAATTLTLTPPSSTVTAGTNVTLAVNVNPGNNQVSFVKLTITYNPGQLKRTGTGLVVTPWKAANGDAVTPQVLAGPSYDDTNGKMSMTISVEASPQHVISTPTQIASVTFDTTTLTGSTTINIDKTTAQVLSIGSTDQFNENVLLDTVGATINIPATPSITPTVTPTSTPTVTPTVTITPTNSPTPTTAQQTSATGPTCSSLTVNPSAQGTAPYAVNLTATGQDSTSTISKLTFDFGDGQTQDVASSAGLGTNSISVLQSHIYNNPGSYTATAVLTDASGSVSPIGNCSVGISVSSTVIAAAPTTVITEGPSPLPPTGPSQLITIGSIGAVITVIGAILLLAL